VITRVIFTVSMAAAFASSAATLRGLYPRSLSTSGGARPKILCLHGGGGSASGFSRSPGMRALVASNPDFEFVFVSAPYNGLWIRDPPGGKGQATTDPDWASASIAVLDDAVATQGPFAGILGYSQGSAFIPIYLAHAPAGTFQFALMFCGYLTTTHTGLLNRVRAASPFGDIPALVWMGSQDYIISNAMTRGQAAKFTSPRIVTSRRGGHSVPTTSDETYSQVLAFLGNQLQGGGNNEGGGDDKDQNGNDQKDSDKEGGNDDKNDGSKDDGTKKDDAEKCNPNTSKGLVCKSGKKARPGDWGACGRGQRKFTGRLYCPQGFVMCKGGKCQNSAKLCGKAGVEYDKKACDTTGNGKDEDAGKNDDDKDEGSYWDDNDEKKWGF